MSGKASLVLETFVASPSFSVMSFVMALTTVQVSRGASWNSIPEIVQGTSNFPGSPTFIIFLTPLNALLASSKNP
ncbi:hypothetical protein DY000_02032079 [Brassica cretica]|uniref:PGG domain-containing protein n=1 Tax=Brassica cretica TaxID=69181 RepID=A0ABQ7DV97_BRACR|nr:hypothetical protein DY000_02032079 [Brassica cretica]